ncbi:MAG: tRNA (guanosine(46)-N7)-methyltransferase TrmB, partial [Bacteroidota bacterium]
EIWLTFPDPRPKDRDEKHRLTNTYFLGMYKNILKPEGWFKFKTDNTFLFEYTLHALDGLPTKDQIQTYDLYQSDYSEDHFGLKTKYEKIWTEKGEKVKYLKFRFS